MPNFRPFSACRGEISFTQAPHTTTRCYAGAIFLSCNPREHPQRGGHRRNRAHLETQSLAAEPEGHGRARPQKSRMQFDWKKFQQRLKTLQFQRSQFKSRNTSRGIACEIDCGLSNEGSTARGEVGLAARPGRSSHGRRRGLAGLRADAPSHTSATRHRR